MERFLREAPGSPGRGFGGISASRVVFEARREISSLLRCPSEDLVCFHMNVTQAINVALWGLLREGDHAIVSSMDHNAVVRPLSEIRRRMGVEVEVARADPLGRLDPRAVEALIRPNTRLIACLHASNVCGTILPAAEIGEIARRRGIFFLLDCAQTAGVLELDMEGMGVDVLAFTGHKGLLGPQGVGGMALSPRAAEEMRPTICGGTGSRSESEEQPDFMPDKLEAGTPNAVGLAGLLAGIEHLKLMGISRVREHEKRLYALFLERARSVKGLRLHGLADPELCVGVVSLSLEGIDPGELELRLQEEFGIHTRSGLHCAPLAHRTIGTFPRGTLRVSFGPFNGEEDIDVLVEALSWISRG